MSENQKLFALLIDGDNTQSAHIPQILHKLCEYGEPRISKVFHNKSTIEQWEQIARTHSIEPIWVPNNTKQKNSVDIALVMDAMILRYERDEITGFCIVASDGDYTRLARYLKSEGKFVLGIGEQKTPEPFRNACTEFNEVSTTLSSSQPVDLFGEESTPIPEDDFAKSFFESCKEIVESAGQDKDAQVKLRDIWEVMNAKDIEFSSAYPKMPIFVDKVKMLVQAYPNNIVLEEQLDSKPVTHYVYIKST